MDLILGLLSIFFSEERLLCAHPVRRSVQRELNASSECNFRIDFISMVFSNHEWWYTWKICEHIYFLGEAVRRKGRRLALLWCKEQDRVRWFNSATAIWEKQIHTTHVVCMPIFFYSSGYCYRRCDKRFCVACVRFAWVEMVFRLYVVGLFFCCSSLTVYMLPSLGALSSSVGSTHGVCGDSKSCTRLRIPRTQLGYPMLNNRESYTQCSSIAHTHTPASHWMVCETKWILISFTFYPYCSWIWNSFYFYDLIIGFCCIFLRGSWRRSHSSLSTAHRISVQSYHWLVASRFEIFCLYLLSIVFSIVRPSCFLIRLWKMWNACYSSTEQQGWL